MILAFPDGVMVKLFESLTIPQLPPVVVSVSVTEPEYPVGGVYVAFSVVLFGLNVPPIPPSDQTPPVAVPPTDPPSALVVTSTQLEGRLAPASTVGDWGVMLPEDVFEDVPQTF
jgi:hypothetical protein